MARKAILGLSLVAVLALLAPAVAAAEEIDLASIVAPASCPANDGGSCSEAAPAPATDFLGDLGMPDAISLQGDTWTEFRWSYNGCCISQTKYKQQKRTCSCCYVQPPTTRCSGWTDTGTTKCEGACMM